MTTTSKICKNAHAKAKKIRIDCCPWQHCIGPFVVKELFDVVKRLHKLKLLKKYLTLSHNMIETLESTGVWKIYEHRLAQYELWMIELEISGNIEQNKHDFFFKPLFWSVPLPLCHAGTFSHGLCLALGNKLTPLHFLCVRVTTEPGCW